MAARKKDGENILQKNQDQEARLVGYIKENQDKFYRLAYSYVKNQEDALDVIQDAIIRAMEKIHTLKNPEYLKTWFYRILVNECLNHIRKAKSILYTDQIPVLEGETNTFGEREAAIDLYHAIDKLEPNLKTIVMLRFYEDMKLKEISKVTSCHLSTVKARLYKALSILRVDIEGDPVYGTQNSLIRRKGEKEHEKEATKSI